MADSVDALLDGEEDTGDYDLKDEEEDALLEDDDNLETSAVKANQSDDDINVNLDEVDEDELDRESSERAKFTNERSSAAPNAAKSNDQIQRKAVRGGRGGRGFGGRGGAKMYQPRGVAGNAVRPRIDSNKCFINPHFKGNVQLNHAWNRKPIIPIQPWINHPQPPPMEPYQQRNMQQVMREPPQHHIVPLQHLTPQQQQHTVFEPPPLMEQHQPYAPQPAYQGPPQQLQKPPVHQRLGQIPQVHVPNNMYTPPPQQYPQQQFSPNNFNAQQPQYVDPNFQGPPSWQTPPPQQYNQPPPPQMCQPQHPPPPQQQQHQFNNHFSNYPPQQPCYPNFDRPMPPQFAYQQPAPQPQQQYQPPMYHQQQQSDSQFVPYEPPPQEPLMYENYNRVDNRYQPPPGDRFVPQQQEMFAGENGRMAFDNNGNRNRPFISPGKRKIDRRPDFSEMIRKKISVDNKVLHEVKMVDSTTIPVHVPQQKKTVTTTAPPADEDEETRKYRQRIEEQKKLRERLLAEKEQRRKMVAQQKLQDTGCSPAVPAARPSFATGGRQDPDLPAQQVVPLLAIEKQPKTNNAGGGDTSATLFLSNRKVFAKDNTLVDTSVVVVSNLAAGTTQVKLKKLCQTVGDVKKIEMCGAQSSATIEFNSVASAHAFFKRYQRYMLDLSVIQVTLKDPK